MFTKLIFFCIVYAVFGGYIPLSDKQEKRLDEWNDDDQNMWQLSGQTEGDMILNEDQLDQIYNPQKNRNGVLDTRYRWPNRQIPYEFSPSITEEQRNIIRQALTEYTRKTCIRPRPRNANDRDFVRITNIVKRGCFSIVGRNGGQQQLNLEYPGCYRNGTIMHEFLHALGFYHMHSDPTRDRYVYIDFNNVENNVDIRRQFVKYESGVSSLGYRYDYGSVMHYDNRAFSKNGLPTIITTNPRNSPIGQRVKLSPTDIAKLHRMYGC